MAVSLSFVRKVPLSTTSESRCSPNRERAPPSTDIPVRSQGS